MEKPTDDLNRRLQILVGCEFLGKILIRDAINYEIIIGGE